MSAHAKLGAGNPKCPRCHKSVYANEKIIALGQDYHIQCLKCASCNKVHASVSLSYSALTLSSASTRST